MTTDAAADIGVVGLGIMGSAMSARILQAGRRVIATDVDPGRCRDHRARGGVAVDTPDAVARAASVIVTSLPTDASLLDVIAGPGGLGDANRADLIVIETSTLSLAAKSDARELGASRGITLLDCPVSGSAPQALAGELVAYLSGDDAAKVIAVDALKEVARRRFDVGEFGNGSRFKFVTNLLVAVHTMAAAEALLLAERFGLDAEQVLEMVGESAGTSQMFQLRGPLMTRELYGEPRVRVRTFLKDLAVIGDAAAAVDSPTPLLSTCAAYYHATEDADRGDQDLSAVFAVLRGFGHGDTLVGLSGSDPGGLVALHTRAVEDRT